MITPLMLILSSIKEDLTLDKPMDTLYLSRQDREVIISEANRFGAILKDEDRTYIEESPTGLNVVSDAQIVGDSIKRLNPYTALLLTRVLKCFKVFERVQNDTTATTAKDDISTDNVVLRIEGNPKYVYAYVFITMENKALNYESKIDKIRELLSTLTGHIGNNSLDGTKTAIYNRLELHSNLNFWKHMLMQDYIAYYGTLPPEFPDSTVEEIRSQLYDLGFYGFVNPLTMYQEFATSRVYRKTEVQVEPDVIEYLQKIVLSGSVNR